METKVAISMKDLAIYLEDILYVRNYVYTPEGT